MAATNASGQHQGQRPFAPRKQAEDMTAPECFQNFKKVLDQRAPSRHDASKEVVPGLNVTHGFVRDQRGAISAFDPPNSTIQTIACCINDAGTILGWYIDPGFGPGHGFLRSSDGAFTVFDPPGSLITEVGAINAAGAATGFYCDAALACRAYLRIPRRSEAAGG